MSRHILLTRTPNAENPRGQLVSAEADHLRARSIHDVVWPNRVERGLLASLLVVLAAKVEKI